MVPLIATDEYASALRAIASQAEIGLSAAPGQADGALRAIQLICEKTASNVTEALSYPDVASQVGAADIEVQPRPRYQLAALLAEMPDGLPRVDGWDGL